MTKKLPIIGVQDSATCTKCGGVCCNGTPGAYSPKDFTDENGEFCEVSLFLALASGDLALAFWDNGGKGDPLFKYCPSHIYFPRPQFKKKSRHGLYEDDWGIFEEKGGCTFLTESGCYLEFENRPYGCRTLVPSWDDENNHPTCKNLDGISDNKRAALEWGYSSLQSKLVELARIIEPDEYNWQTH